MQTGTMRSLGIKPEIKIASTGSLTEDYLEEDLANSR